MAQHGVVLVISERHIAKRNLALRPADSEGIAFFRDVRSHIEDLEEPFHPGQGHLNVKDLLAQVFQRRVQLGQVDVDHHERSEAQRVVQDVMDTHEKHRR